MEKEIGYYKVNDKVFENKFNWFRYRQSIDRTLDDLWLEITGQSYE